MTVVWPRGPGTAHHLPFACVSSIFEREAHHCSIVSLVGESGAPLRDDVVGLACVCVHSIKPAACARTAGNSDRCTMASPKLDNLADLGSPPRGGSRGLPSVKPAPPPGTPERRRMKILPSSYMPSTAPMQTPPRHAPPAAIRGMEDTEFNANDAVIREGYLMKLKQTHRWAQHSRWNKRWFQLRGGFLLYFKRQGNDKPAGWLRVAQIREIKPLDSNTLIPGGWAVSRAVVSCCLPLGATAQTDWGLLLLEPPGTNRSGENCISICLHTRKLWLRARSLKEVC